MSRRKPEEREANRQTILDLLETTPATEARPVTPGQPEELVPDIDFDWRPTPLGSIVRSRRQYRWPVVIGALLVGLAVLFVARFFILLPADEAEARLADYAAAIDEFDGALDAMEAAASLTDPTAASRFLAAADALREVATPGPPGLLPFLPAGPVGDVKAARVRLLALADAADSIAERLALGSTYRAASEDILAIPLLPFSAPPELIDPAAEALAEMQADSEAAAAALDDEDEGYAGYRDAVAAALEELPGWIDRYLLALRREDEAGAVALVAELQALRDGTLAELDASLASVESDAADLVESMRRRVEEIRILVGSG